LNEIDGDSSDDGLDTNEMLEQYSKLKDSPSVDPDYEPEEEVSSEDITDGELDTEEEKTESQRKLNGGDLSNLTANGSVNGHSSDIDSRVKSKKETGLPLDKQQLAELENQLVMKIMKHFKTAYNYAPEDGGASGTSLDDVFYSPIGSPPEKGYISDSDIPTKKGDESINDVQQNQEVTSSQVNPETHENNQV